MPPVGFEPTISAGEGPQTYALDRAATILGHKCDKYVHFGPKYNTIYTNMVSDTVSPYNYTNITPHSITAASSSMTQFNDIEKVYTRAVLSFFDPRRRQLSLVVVFFMCRPLD